MRNKKPISNHYDFIAYMECNFGIFNGDPEDNNNQRIDPYTGKAFATDVCIKHKIRHYVDVVKGEEEGYRIYIKSDNYLNAKDEEAVHFFNADTPEALKKSDPDADKKLMEFMANNYFDVRTFGGAFTSFASSGLTSRVNGPVQIGYSVAVTPAGSEDITIIRDAVATAADYNERNKRTEMGNKTYMPYGLFRLHGHISVDLAEKTGFSEEDKDLLFEAIENMFEFDRSAVRSDCCTRKLIIFKHAKKRGNAPAHKLFDAVTESYAPESRPSRYSDITITIDKSKIPDGVELIVRE